MQFFTTIPTLLSLLPLTLTLAAPGTASPAAPPLVAHPAALVPNPDAAQFSGYATYYYQNGAYGSCGEKHTDSEILCAVSRSKIAGHCGHSCKLSANGHTIYGRVVDTCPGCTDNHVDISVEAFKELSNNNLAQGTINLSWDIL